MSMNSTLSVEMVHVKCIVGWQELSLWRKKPLGTPLNLCIYRGCHWYNSSRWLVEGAHSQGIVSPVSLWRCLRRKALSWCPLLFPVFFWQMCVWKEKALHFGTMSKSVCMISRGNETISLSSKEWKHSEVPSSCEMLRWRKETSMVAKM